MLKVVVQTEKFDIICAHVYLLVIYSNQRNKRCDQIEERKARRLTGKIVPKGDVTFIVLTFCTSHHVTGKIYQAPSPAPALGPAKRRRASLSAGHSSNEDADDSTPWSPSGPPPDDAPSLSVRKQPKRVVKPRIYFDLLEYDSDLDVKAAPSSTSPARRRGHGPRFNQGSSLNVLMDVVNSRF